MKKIISIIALLMIVLQGSIFAQGAVSIELDADNDGTVRTVPGEGLFIMSEGGNTGQNYLAGRDFSITLVASCDSSYVFCLEFLDFAIEPCDTVFVYDGASTSAPLRIKANDSLNSLLNKKVFCGPNNHTGTLTLRFKTSISSPTGMGFRISCLCGIPCEVINPVLVTTFYKTRNGVIYDTFHMINYVDYDTIWATNNNGDFIYNDDSTRVVEDLIPKPWRGINLCQGDGLIFLAHGIYTHDHGYYDPCDDSTTFYWRFGNGDTLVEKGATRVPYDKYYELSCYDVMLSIIDQFGCVSNLYETAIVRLAQNPIKTIYDLATICNTDSLYVNVGYEGENGTMTLQRISFERIVSKTFDARTFIPDGPYCTVPCYSAPVTFTEFPNGRTVTSAEDVCSICVNYEHSYMGDYEISVVCPSGSRAALKYYTSGAGLVTGMYGGGGTLTGGPFGGSNHGGYDNVSGNYCDSIYNPAGFGLDYCFTRNEVDYRYIGGTQTASYLACSGNDTTISYTFPPTPPGYRVGNQGTGLETFVTRAPSWHDQKDHYYAPADDMSQLIGCPLNGTWNIEICDHLGIDNGWVFNWSLDICGIGSGNGCEYQVGLDSVIWRPDSSYGDFDKGYYRGAYVKRLGGTNAQIASPDTAGFFKLLITAYDEFGCIWDTSSQIVTVWNPKPDLPDSVILCDVETVELDATDVHTSISNQSFMWEPFGDTARVLTTRTGLKGSTLYMVEVTNDQNDIRCRARDSIRVNVYAQPKPNFDPGVYPLEGCEPLDLTFENTSKFGNIYRWEFVDGTISEEMSPRHSYSAGTYDLKYYIVGDGGCNDSLIFKDLITVYTSPQARFSWAPLNPSVKEPTVTFLNATRPRSDDMKYYWEIQYDKDYPLSYHTLTDVNPSFTWEIPDMKTLPGSYIVRLIAKTVNRGPSGKVTECIDTLENSILIVNDFIEFPNVVTANGDGINDKFVIINLLEGLAYPTNEFSVYNRWGSRVYHVKNISSEDDFWDPERDNIPSGTYFWHFVGMGYRGSIERHGSVEVIR